MLQPDDPGVPQASEDHAWWWNGARWLPAGPQPPPSAIASQPGLPPPPPVAPGRALRIVVLVALALVAVPDAFFVLTGTVAESQMWSGGQQDVEGLLFLLGFVAILVLAVLGFVGMWMRTNWGRWVAFAAGIGATLTCVGALLGILIIVGALRAPWRKRPAT